ncbi:hypothetical protein HN873_059624, partial [Arachis hypogaea]
MNLTAVKDADEVMERHIEDSLEILPPLRNCYRTRCGSALSHEKLSLVDVGTGAEWKVTLMESMNKRCVFLEHVVGIIGSSTIQIIRERAEDAFGDAALELGKLLKPQLMKGNMQLYSMDQQCSQALEAHAASFAQFKDMRQQTNETGEVTTPIIVRSHVATEEDVKEAIRLFTMSTMDAARSGIHQQISLTPEMENEIKKKDNFKNPLYIENLMEEYVTSFWVDETLLSDWKQQLEHEVETMKAQSNVVSIHTRYVVNGMSYVAPNTPLKPADYFNITGVFSVGTIPTSPSRGTNNAYFQTEGHQKRSHHWHYSSSVEKKIEQQLGE